MAREERKIELRTVDDAAPPRKPVIRLGGDGLPPEKPVRVGRAQPAEAHRLDVKARGNFENRTHQPGIETLIENEAPDPDALETDWGRASGQEKHVPWGWFALVGLILAGAVIWSLARVGEAEILPGGARDLNRQAISDEGDEEIQASRLIGRIDKVAREFVQASTVERLAELVRQPERVRPLMKNYYATHPLKTHTISRDALLQPLTLDHNADFWIKLATIEDNGTVNLLIDVSDPKHPLVDWETYVCYQPMPWDDFAQKLPQGGSHDFRVFLKPDHLFAYEFADPDRWECYRLTALDSERPVFGYAKKGGPLSERIQAALEENNGEKSAVIVRVTVPPGVESPNSVVIEELLSKRWLYIDPPDSGS